MLNQSGLLECPIDSVLRDGLQGPCTELNGNITVQLRHPKPPGFQIWYEEPGRVRGNVLADPAFFLRHTTPMNGVTFGRLSSGDAANSGHKITLEKSEEHGSSLRPGQERKRPSSCIASDMLLLRSLPEPKIASCVGRQYPCG
jgi:hypothetical protein